MMRYLSLFSGVEAASVAWMPFGWEPVAFCEVDEFPSAVLAERFPNVPNLGDITKVDWRPYKGNVDLLVGGSPCFTAGTLVLCESGFKPIEEVEVGEKVVTHKGRLKRVLRTGSRYSDIGVLNVHGMLPIRCTPNHPILASRRTKRAKADEHGSWFNFHGEQFVAASESVGMCACSVENVECAVPDYPKVYAATHGDITELIGWYLGDGSVVGKGRRNPGSRELSLSINYSKLEKFESKFSKSVSYRVVRIDETRCKVLISCTDLCRFLEKNFGRGAAGKNMPPWVFALCDDEKQRLFDGYMATDGSTRSDGISVIESVSKPLIIGMQMLMRRGSACMPEHRGTTTINGKEYAVRQSYKYSLPVGRGRVFHNGGYSKRLIKSYELCGTSRVYNLEVEDDNSYTADGIAVHNCQSFSVAGKRESLQGASRLMFEYIRAVDEVRPRWFVWENVPGALSAKGLEGEAGGAFRQLIREMGELGYGCAWRILDAQFARVPNFGGSGLFGPVAQRRRRVFLVGHIGDDPAGPVEVLFEREGLRGDNPPSREKRKALAAAARDGAEAASAWFKFHQGSGAGGVGYGEEQSSTLTTDWHQPAVLTPCDVQSKRIYSGCGTSPTLPSGTNEGMNIQPIVATNVYQFNGHIIGRKPENGGNSCLAADPDEFGACTLTATDQQTVVYDSEVLAFAQNTRDEVRIFNGDGTIVGALAAQPGMKQTSYVMTDTQARLRGGVPRVIGEGMEIRRLTPMECERLQGFPSVIELEVEKMTSDELIACALTNGDIVCDFEKGLVLGTRGPGGMELETPRVLGFKHPSGYIHINLSANGHKKQVRAHRVIYIAAHGGIPDGMVVDHINGVKDDNRLVNLQALTSEGNSHKAKDDGAYDWNSDPDRNPRMVPYEIRAQIRSEHANGLGNYRSLAAKYGCSKSTIANIIHETGWTEIPYRGKPAEECPDGPRYKAMGNSMAVNVMRWIGDRIDRYEHGAL